MLAAEWLLRVESHADLARLQFESDSPTRSPYLLRMRTGRFGFVFGLLAFIGMATASSVVLAEPHRHPVVSAVRSDQRRAELLRKYPSLSDGSRTENRKILCPFHRLLDRTGMYDSSRTLRAGIRVAVGLITQLASEFGCSKVSCGAVAAAVSAGQLTQGTTSFGKVNIESLHTAAGIAHDCGLTFEKGGQEVSDRVRDRTLAELKTLSDPAGHLTLAALRRVQLNRCEEQGVRPSQAGILEGELIFTFLGGNERGFILYSDVDRFLHAQLPETLGEPETAKK
jgi:hypothetical protein